MANVPVQIIASDFFTASLADPLTKLTIIPASDLAFVRDVNLFFLKRIQPSYHWAPLAVPEYAKAPTLHALLIQFMGVEHPTRSASPAFLSGLSELLIHACPRVVDSTADSTTISFTDNMSFDFGLTDSEGNPRPAFVPTDPSKQFTLLSLPFASPELNRPTPRFDAFLEHAFPEDTDAFKSYVYELIGYLLLPPTLSREPATFYLYGVTGSGKSVFLDIIEALFPPYLKAAIGLGDLTTNRFSVASLAGKLMNIVDEDESDYVNGGKLKALTSQRPVQVERKGEQGFTFTPHAKFIFASNHLPTLKNIDPAVERRLHLLSFEHRVPERLKDINLAPKIIKEELAGIVGKAINAANLLIKSNITFHQPQASLDARTDFMIESSSPASFFHACYQVQDGATTSNNQLYEDYLAYCQKFKKNPQSTMKFHVALKSIPGLESIKSNGTRFKNCAKRVDAPLLNV